MEQTRECVDLHDSAEVCCAVTDHGDTLGALQGRHDGKPRVWYEQLGPVQGDTGIYLVAEGESLCRSIVPSCSEKRKMSDNSTSGEAFRQCLTRKCGNVASMQ